MMALAPYALSDDISKRTSPLSGQDSQLSKQSYTSTN